MLTLGTLLIVLALALAVYPLARPTSTPVLHYAVILLCLALLLGRVVLVP
jgi:hypothetical protein